MAKFFPEAEAADRAEMAGFREADIERLASPGSSQLTESTLLTVGWPDVISRKAYDFVVRWETGGRAYYEQVIKGRPVWPEYASGITIGCGYDLGYHTLPQFQNDWGARLPAAEFDRLAKTIGFCTAEPDRAAKVTKAKELVKSFKDVVVPWDVAIAQFDGSKMPTLVGQLYAAVDTLDKLHPHCRGALLSLVFNRGNGGFTSGKDRFREMVEIRRLMRAGTAAEFARVPEQLRAMRRIWGEESSLSKRRSEEAELFEAGLAEMGLTESLASLGAGMALESAGEELVEDHRDVNRQSDLDQEPGDEAMEKIDRATFEARLADPNVPESALRPYLTLDRVESQAFRPSVVANPSRIAYGDEEAAVAMASLNGVSRWRRQTLYRWKIGSWTGLRVVAEGDSWFQYPFLIDDVIDHLFDPWAIYCVSGAGDLLSDMSRQDEVTAALVAERPDILILSGGGNDLLGDGRLARYLKPHASGMTAAQYITPAFDELLAKIIAIYGELIGKALSAGAKRVVCHSYDYCIPNGGPWLGRPMLKLGIADRAMQRAIIRILIDRFHAALTTLAAGLGGKLAVADCRGQVADDQWYDELHPTSAGFRKVARIVRAAGEGVPVEELAEAGLEAMEAPQSPRPLPVADADTVEALLAADSDTLFAEIGRRAAIIEVSPDAAGSYALELSASSTSESFVSDFKDLGSRVFDRLHRELYKLLCGDGGAASAERDKLRKALRLEQAALIGAISAALVAIAVPPLLAPLVAAVIVKSGIDPAWEVTCKWWGERLGEPSPPPPPAQ